MMMLEIRLMVVVSENKNGMYEWGNMQKRVDCTNNIQKKKLLELWKY